MNLTLKSLLIIGLAVIGLMALIYLVSESIILQSYRDLEQREIRQNVARTLSAFADGLDGIDTFLRDWSSWDDTCAFVADPRDTAGYAASNLVAQSFTNPRHNFMLFFNAAGDLVRGLGYDLKAKAEVPVPASLRDYFGAAFAHRRPSAGDEPVKGILVLPEGVALLSARPILASDETGPSRGTLVMGRFLGREDEAKLSRGLLGDLQILRPEDKSLPEKCRAALLARSDPDGIHVHTSGENLATGLALIRDIDGRPALVLRIAQERRIYQRGLMSMRYYNRWLIVLALAVLAVTALILQFFVLAPLRRLSRSLKRIASARDPKGRVPIVGRDELGALAASVNAMLASLESAQEELRNSEERYRGVVEDQTELICRFLPDFTLTFVNEAYCRCFGQNREALLGRSFLTLIAEEDRGRVAANIAALSAERPFSSHEERVLMPDSSTRWQSWTNRLILSRSGRVCEYQAVGRDITDQKRLQGEILRAQKLESVGTLAGGIAHDFNNILVAILGNLSLARNILPSSERALSLIAEAEKASLRARDLARQLLTFARGGASVRKTVRLGRAIADAARMALSGSRCSGDIQAAGDLWAVEADEGQIAQAVNNLVINAAQAMAGGGVVTVRAENARLPAGLVSGLPEGEYILISVRDRGIGIPDEHVSRIFDPYFTTKQDGSGLGLAIVYSIVVGHGGAITVESKPGEGSVFRVYLPARPGAPVAEAAGGSAPRGRGRVLLMDDDETVAAVTAQMLAHLGYRAETAKDGEAMLSAYGRAQEARDPFAAVILDLTVPGGGMGGKEAIGRLKRLDPQAKVIVASGYSSDPVMAGFAQFGFAGAIAKPYDLAELGGALRSVLSKE